MFSAERDASKIALVSMTEKLRSSGYVLFDTQLMTEHLRSMGAIEIPRAEYLERVKRATARAATFTP